MGDCRVLVSPECSLFPANLNVLEKGGRESLVLPVPCLCPKLSLAGPPQGAAVTGSELCSAETKGRASCPDWVHGPWLTAALVQTPRELGRLGVS